tara:strand:- start:328 stop:1251 length:924 start_codon:yes stop_codon:yes gene_type:complete
MKKILITGVAGFIGSHLAKRFIHEGYKVFGIDNLSNGKIENVPNEVEFMNIDLSVNSEIEKIPSECEIIAHLAGQSSGEISYHEPIIDLNKNTISTLNLINYGIQNKIEKILYASSMSVYGDIKTNNKGVSESQYLFPKSCYGVSKLSSEKYLRIYKNKIPFVSLRMFNVYGPGQDLNNLRQGMVSIYLAQALKSSKIIIKGSLSRFRDFIFIDDVVEAWFRASKFSEAINQEINIGTGIKTTVKDLTRKIFKLTNVYDYEIHEETPCDQLGIYADVSKIKNILKIDKFVSLDDGLEIFHDWVIKSS